MKVTGSTIQQLDKSKPRSKCRKWRLWATTDNGRKSRRFEGTYTQAQDALKAFVEELEGFVPNSETFGAYAESWRLWRAESGDFSPNSLRCDEQRLKALRRTRLAGMRMDEITPDVCRDELLWLKRNPLKCAEYSQNTMDRLYQTLLSVFQQAVDDGKLASNPMSKVKRPKVKSKEKSALSPDEMQLLLNRLDSMDTTGYVMAVYLMLCLGLRCGEACALKDSEIDSRYARVTSTMREADNTPGPPKSESGNRVLPVPPRLAAKVEEWREVRRRRGFSDEALCLNMKGGPLRTVTLRSWWEHIRADIGCEGMTMHELRHSNLSMVARHMSVFDLQRYAGWSSIAPARIYVHDDLDAVARAVEMAWK